VLYFQNGQQFQFETETEGGTETEGKRNRKIELISPLAQHPRFGTIDRSGSSDVSLTMGSLEQRQAAGTQSHQIRHARGPRITGKLNIYNYITKVLESPKTLAFRDCFVHWREHKQMGRAGKIFIIDSFCPKDRHAIFFDDNIRYDDARIVDVCDIRSPSHSVPLPRAIDKFLVRVEPLESITDDDYFIKKIHMCEEKLNHSILTRNRMRDALLRLVQANKVLLAMHGSDEKTYVPFNELESVERCSTSLTFEEEHDQHMHQNRNYKL